MSISVNDWRRCCWIRVPRSAAFGSGEGALGLGSLLAFTFALARRCWWACCFFVRLVFVENGLRDTLPGRDGSGVAGDRRSAAGQRPRHRKIRSLVVGRLRMALAMKAVARAALSLAGRPVQERLAYISCPSGAIETTAASSSSFLSSGPADASNSGSNSCWSTWANYVTMASGVSSMLVGLAPQ